MHDLKLESDLVVSIFRIGVNNQNLVFLIAFLEADFKGCVVLEALQGGIFKGCNFIIIKGEDAELVCGVFYERHVNCCFQVYGLSVLDWILLGLPANHVEDFIVLREELNDWSFSIDFKLSENNVRRSLYLEKPELMVAD